MTREDAMTTTDDKQKEKIKTPFAKVIVEGRGANSYFSILYFDPTDKDFHIGYSSYYLNYVFNWLNEEFEIVEDGNSTLPVLRPISWKQVEKVWRGEWKQDKNGQVVCSRCGAITAIGSKAALHNANEYDRFCFSCGAPMTDEAIQMVMERLEEMYPGIARAMAEQWGGLEALKDETD